MDPNDIPHQDGKLIIYGTCVSTDGYNTWIKKHDGSVHKIDPEREIPCLGSEE